MKHTPAPWKLSMNNGSGRQILGVIGNGAQQNHAEYLLRGDIPIPLFSDVWVQFPSDAWNEMQDANARLIAAAPELLDRLEQNQYALKEWLRNESEAVGGEYHSQKMKAIENTMTKNQMIISKAKGL